MAATKIRKKQQQPFVVCYLLLLFAFADIYRKTLNGSSFIRSNQLKCNLLSLFLPQEVQLAIVSITLLDSVLWPTLEQTIIVNCEAIILRLENCLKNNPGYIMFDYFPMKLFLTSNAIFSSVVIRTHNSMQEGNHRASASETRFRHFGKQLKDFEVLYSIWYNCEPSLVNFNDFSRRHFNVVNRLLSNKQSGHLVTLAKAIIFFFRSKTSI